MVEVDDGDCSDAGDFDDAYAFGRATEAPRVDGAHTPVAAAGAGAEAGQSRGELPRRFVPSSLASAPYGSSSYGDDGSSVEQSLHMMAVCVISFIVSCAARPRDGSGQIMKDALPMRHLISDELLDFMQVVFGTDDFATLEAMVRLHEDAELHETSPPRPRPPSTNNLHAAERGRKEARGRKTAP